jgi:hypothetical protein
MPGACLLQTQLLTPGGWPHPPAWRQQQTPTRQSLQSCGVLLPPHLGPQEVQAPQLPPHSNAALHWQL